MKNQALIANRHEYSVEYDKLNAQKLEAKKKLAVKLAELDSRSQEVQKQSFAVNLKMAKFQRKILPYSNLTFRRYVHEAMFNPPAA